KSGRRPAPTGARLGAATESPKTTDDHLQTRSRADRYPSRPFHQVIALTRTRAVRRWRVSRVFPLRALLAFGAPLFSGCSQTSDAPESHQTPGTESGGKPGEEAGIGGVPVHLGG